MAKTKQEVFTFKADPDLAELLHAMPNRSEFIRRALLASLENVCPLCQGTGILTPAQRKHWDRFAQNHRIIRCLDCEDLYISCSHERRTPPSPHQENLETS